VLLLLLLLSPSLLQLFLSPSGRIVRTVTTMPGSITRSREFGAFSCNKLKRFVEVS
jgi:hypothetical protein